MKKRMVSIVLAVLMVVTALPLMGLDGLFTTPAEATLVKDLPSTEFVRFGSYPTKRVTDSMYTTLSSYIGNFDTHPDKKSLRFVFGTGSPGTAKVEENYAHYIDFTYQGEKYRAVKYAAYRPRIAYQSYIPANSLVDDNGYTINTVYFFKYDDLYWEVLDAEKGLLVCTNVVDAAWYNGTYRVVNNKWLVAAAEYPNMYANCYYMSDLNGRLSSQYYDYSFYNVAFDDDQKAMLADVPIANEDQNGNVDWENYPDPGFTAKVSSLSLSQYSAYRAKHKTEVCKPTDYAKCMGVAYDSTTEACSFWLTNRYTHSQPVYFSKFAAFVGYNGDSVFDSQVDCLHGVRPVIRLTGDYDLTQIELKFNGTPTVGNTPSNFVVNPGKLSDKHYYVNNVSWKEGSGSYSTNVPTMKSGKTYTVRLQIFPDTGWMFAPNMTLNVKGASLKPVSANINSAFAILEYQFTIPEPQPVYGFQVGWQVPKIGDTLVHQAANYSCTTGPSAGVQYFTVTEKWTKNGSAFNPGSTITAGTYTVDVTYKLKAGYYMADSFQFGERVVSFWKPDSDILLEYDVDKGTAHAQATYTLSNTINYLNLMIPQDPLPGNEIKSYATPGARDKAGNYVAGTSTGCAVTLEGYWYEGKDISNPTQMHAGDKFVKGKTYTYRFTILPNTGFSWGSNPSFTLNTTDKSPTKKLLNVGRYIVDFTYENLPDRLTNVVISNVTRPCNGAGFRTDPAVSANGNEANKYFVNLAKGWYDKPDGSIVAAPQVGEVYYMQLVLGAYDGYSFSPYTDSLSVSLRDKDMNTVPFEGKQVKVWTRTRDNDTATVWVGIKCNEIHSLKNVLDGLDSPKIGKPLDTEVTVNAPLAHLAFISYYINGEKVIDPDTTPAAGDVVDVYVGLVTHSGAVFDENVYLNWVVDGDTINSRRTYRDYSLGLPDDVAGFKLRFVMPYPKTPEPVETFTFENATQPVKGQKVSSSVTSGAPDKYLLANDNGAWFTVDGLDPDEQLESSDTFQADTMYALRVVIKMQDGYNFGKSPKFKLTDKNGTEVDVDHIEYTKQGDNYIIWFFVNSLASTPAKTVDEVVINGVTQPVNGQTVGDGDMSGHAAEWATLGEPWKYQFMRFNGGYWLEMYDLDHSDYISAGSVFDSKTAYAIRFYLKPQPGYQFADPLRIVMYDDNGKEVDYGYYEMSKDFETGAFIFEVNFNQTIDAVPEKETFYTMVKNGKRTPTGPQEAGTKITITADAAPEGKVFSRWVVDSGNVKLASITSATTTFIQPAENVTVTAVFVDKSESVMLGDVDNDKKITASDARLALRRAVDLETYPAGSREFKACDVDKDGKVTAGDARHILRAAVSLEDPTKW
ncbi:MAG: hypothetical protein IK104_09290 [Clostridia bacterium]|nr:hypothetical protein [Clostridia bacterium]